MAKIENRTTSKILLLNSNRFLGVQILDYDSFFSRFYSFPYMYSLKFSWWNLQHVSSIFHLYFRFWFDLQLHNFTNAKLQLALVKYPENFHLRTWHRNWMENPIKKSVIQTCKLQHTAVALPLWDIHKWCPKFWGEF